MCSRPTGSAQFATGCRGPHAAQGKWRRRPRTLVSPVSRALQGLRLGRGACAVRWREHRREEGASASIGRQVHVAACGGGVGAVGSSTAGRLPCGAQAGPGVVAPIRHPTVRSPCAAGATRRAARLSRLLAPAFSWPPPRPRFLPTLTQLRLTAFPPYFLVAVSLRAKRSSMYLGQIRLHWRAQ